MTNGGSSTHGLTTTRPKSSAVGSSSTAAPLKKVVDSPKGETIDRSLKKSTSTATPKSQSSSSRRAAETRAKIFSNLAAKASKNKNDEEGWGLTASREQKEIPDFAAQSTVLQFLTATNAVRTRPPVNPITIDLSAPKEILSHAQRRKLKQPVVVLTKEQKEAFREEKRAERKIKRLLKSNGARRKVARLQQKRRREEEGEVEQAMQALDPDFQPRTRGRRLEE